MTNETSAQAHATTDRLKFVDAARDYLQLPDDVPDSKIEAALDGSLLEARIRTYLAWRTFAEAVDRRVRQDHHRLRYWFWRVVAAVRGVVQP